MKCRFCSRESGENKDFIFIRRGSIVYVVCLDCYFVIKFVIKEALEEMQNA